MHGVSDTQLRGLNKSVIQIIGLLVEKFVSNLGDHYLNLYFLLHVSLLLLWHLPPMQPNSHQMSHFHANKTPYRLIKSYCLRWAV